MGDIAPEPIIEALPPLVAKRLGWYVYLYIDPRSSPPSVFYVGKGKGSRIVHHMHEEGEARKHRILRELRACGLGPRIDLLAYQLPSDEIACRIEAAALDLLGLDQLANAVRGLGSLEMGRIALSEAVAQYGAQPVELSDPAIAFGINRLFRPHMSAEELYEATRGVWRANGKRRDAAKYAFAVFRGVVREVYEIAEWEPADPSSYRTRKAVPSHDDKGRRLWQFVGRVAAPRYGIAT